MKVTVKQLKQLIREQVEEILQDTNTREVTIKFDREFSDKSTEWARPGRLQADGRRGPSRPIGPRSDRARMRAALENVSKKLNISLDNIQFDHSPPRATVILTAPLDAEELKRLYNELPEVLDGSLPSIVNT